MVLASVRQPKHIFLLIYWLAFVWLAIGAGHSPGFIMHPEAAPYPTPGVMVLCMILAVLVVLLSLVMHPPANWRPRVRFALRGVYVLLLLVMLALGMGTDMEGIVYVPAKFALVTLLFLAVWAVIPRRGNKDDPSRTVA